METSSATSASEAVAFDEHPGAGGFQAVGLLQLIDGDLQRGAARTVWKALARGSVVA